MPPRTPSNTPATRLKSQPKTRRKRSRWAWVLAVLCALVLLPASALWWWAGTQTSLATTVQYAQRWLPQGSQLVVQGSHASLRHGGSIDTLQWSSPGLQVQATGVQAQWSLWPLLQGQLTLHTLHAKQVHITSTPTQQAPKPMQPPSSLALPLRIDAPLHIDTLQWQGGSNPVQATQLQVHYLFDGTQHQLRLAQLAMAQGQYTTHYQGQATVQAQHPMALQAQLQGTVQGIPPGGGPAQALALNATLQGPVGDTQTPWQLQLQATGGSAAPAKATEKTPANAPPASVQPPVQAPIQAQVQATLRPWQAQPLVQARVALQGIDLAPLWPGAPTTALHGTAQATPQLPGEAASPLHIQSNLRNDAPGPWDTGRLPLAALQADAHYNGTRWDVAQLTARIGKGSVQIKGHFTPSTGAADGQALLRQFPPAALHTALAAAPLDGNVTAQMQAPSNGSHATDLRFAINIRTPANAGNITGTHRIDQLQAEGLWQPHLANGTLVLQKLNLQALQTRVQATRLQIQSNGAVRGDLQINLPGASLSATGHMAQQEGQGKAQLQWSDAARTQRWLADLQALAQLPGMPAVLAELPQQWLNTPVQGQADMSVLWTGGWQDLTQPPLTQPRLASTRSKAQGKPLNLQATLAIPRMDAGPSAHLEHAVQLRGVQIKLAGTLADASVALDGQVRTGAAQTLRTWGLHTSATTRISTPREGQTQLQAQLQALRLQMQTPKASAPWVLTLADPVSLQTLWNPTQVTPLTLAELTPGELRLSGPAPGSPTLRWTALRYSTTNTTSSNPQWATQGSLKDLPLAWVDALGLQDTGSTLASMGLGGDVQLDGDWKLALTDTLRGRASLRRARGDLRVFYGAINNLPASLAGSATGSPAGLTQAEATLEANGPTVSAQVQWRSTRAGEVTASGQTNIQLPPWLGGPANPNGTAPLWAQDAPISAQVRANLPDLGVWSALAPPGWRVRGTLQADLALSGQRNAPRWAGTLGANGLAVRSIADGIDLQNGLLRATLSGNQMDITQLELHGGRGNKARILGISGNRTAAPQDGGTLTGTGTVRWNSTGGDAAPGIEINLQTQANALQVLVRADRQISVSGPLQLQLRQGQVTMRGNLTADRATIVLPDETTPTLGSDVVVRAKKPHPLVPQAPTRPDAPRAQARTAKPPDIAITVDLGRDFAVQGHGLTTRLEGQLEIRSSAASALPRVTGEVRTLQGRYRAWGQMLDVETGLLRFSGALDNPALDILALRPNMATRVGVQITGAAQNPRVRLYADPELPDAEKLSLLVLGRNSTGSGAQAGLLQQAAMALLGGKDNNASTQIASSIGLDEIGLTGIGNGEDASSAALSLGKRITQDLYVTYEHSLSSTLGTLYIFYDLSKRLTLRGQTGAQSAVDIIYTVRYD
jgi:translocation and assembly module TamB